MKKVIIVITLIFPPLALSQETPESDPFDLSKSTSSVEELGVVTKPQVDALESQSRDLFNAGDCSAAIPVLVEYSRKSNWLANMISANLDPYYGASYDERKDYPYAKLEPLVPLETLSNQYKQKRNIAIAMQGECLLKIGNKEAAVPVLLKALDLFDIDSDEWWGRTRKNLLEIIEVQ